jgi:hypothetical protein
MPSNSRMLGAGPHLRPVGSLPGAAELLVCALLYSSYPTAVQIAEYIDANADLDEPARSAYRAAVELARQHIAPAPQLVIDELRRTGHLDRQTACWLASAVTTGAPPETAAGGGANVPGSTGYNNSNVSGNSAGPGTQTAPRLHPVPQSGH